MADEAAHLADAKRHIAQSRSLIRRQEQLIAGLAGSGRDTDAAKDLLDVLTITLRNFESHRSLILHNMARKPRE